MVPKFKKDVVYEKLSAAIRSGVYAPGARLPRELDFARELGVSFLTLRAALARLEEDGLIVRIPSKGTFVSDTVNVVSCSPEKGRVLLAIPDFKGDTAEENLFNRNLILGAVKQGYLSGYEIHPCRPSEVDALLDDVVSGVIWDRPLPEVYAQIASYSARGIPQVTVNRHLEGIPAVGCNYPAAIRQAMRYLRSIGHTYVALIDHAPESAAIFAERQEAFFEQLRFAGVEQAENYLIPICSCDSTPELTIARDLFRIPEITALIVSNVFMMQFHHYLKEMRIGVPRELSVILWGENRDFGQHTDYPYSILTEPRSAVGQSAIARIADYHRNATRDDSMRLFDAELLIRSGCALPRNWKQSAGL